MKVRKNGKILNLSESEIKNMKVFLNEDIQKDVKTIIDGCTFIGDSKERIYVDDKDEKIINDKLNKLDINTLKIFSKIVNSSCGFGTDEDSLESAIREIKDSKTLDDIENMFKEPPSYFERIKAKDKYIEQEFGPYTDYKVSCTPCGYNSLEDLIRGETSGPFGKKLLNLKDSIKMSKYKDNDDETIFAESEISKPILDMMKRMNIIK